MYLSIWPGIHKDSGYILKPKNLLKLCISYLTHLKIHVSEILKKY